MFAICPPLSTCRHRFQTVVRHVLGAQNLQGDIAVHLLGDMAKEIAKKAHVCQLHESVRFLHEQGFQSSAHNAARVGNITFLRAILQVCLLPVVSLLHTR